MAPRLRCDGGNNHNVSLQNTNNTTNSKTPYVQSYAVFFLENRKASTRQCREMHGEKRKWRRYAIEYTVEQNDSITAATSVCIIDAGMDLTVPICRQPQQQSRRRVKSGRQCTMIIYLSLLAVDEQSAARV